MDGATRPGRITETVTVAGVYMCIGAAVSDAVVNAVRCQHLCCVERKESSECSDKLRLLFKGQSSGVFQLVVGSSSSNEIAHAGHIAAGQGVFRNIWT